MVETAENNKALGSFNIYYLNFSKVYEISMMIDNVLVSSIQKESASAYETSSTKAAKIEITSRQYLANVKSYIGRENKALSQNSSKIVESLDVKTTKSILLRQILQKCQPFETFDQLREGDLIKVDNVALNILNEENLRQILMLRKDALKGFRVEGMDLNNIISSILQDYSYVLYGDSVDNKQIVIKIPLEIQNEFENKYSVNDLLIGHVSIIGVYKGSVTEDFITSNTFNYFSSFADGYSPVQSDKRIFPSSNKTEQTTSGNYHPNKDKCYQFIDTIAIIQDLYFEKPQSILQTNIPWYKRLWNWLRGQRKK